MKTLKPFRRYYTSRAARPLFYSAERLVKLYQDPAPYYLICALQRQEAAVLMALEDAERRALTPKKRK